MRSYRRGVEDLESLRRLPDGREVRREVLRGEVRELALLGDQLLKDLKR